MPFGGLFLNVKSIDSARRGARPGPWQTGTHVSFSPLTCENRAGSAGLWGSHMSPSNASQAPARRHAEARHTRGPEELTGHTAGK